jgi:hypothetical protein
MGAVLGLGISHWPRLRMAESAYALRLVKSLQDPAIPDDAKNPDNWPPAMREEWGDDEGRTSAPKHRDAIVLGMREARKALDAFKPDAVLVWGDDQYENFREDVIPPFCVLAYQEDVVMRPLGKADNPWGEDADKPFTVRMAPQISKALTAGLIEADFDVSYAYRPLHYPGLSHAFMNAVLYLDFDRTGFEYPVIPFQVNCYGSHVVSHKGSVPQLDAPHIELDPPSPSPRRCFELGRATARFLRDSPWRVALVASSSWSHAFLVSKHWQLYPDVPADRRLYEALLAGDWDAWRETPLASVIDAGQQEVLNWFCLAGAMSELNCPLEWSQFVESYIFNSNKVAAVFRPSDQT